MDYHLKKVREAGASLEEIEKAIHDAIAVRDIAQSISEHHGLERLGIAKELNGLQTISETSRITELVSIGAAFAVNCTSSLEKFITSSKKLGITDAEIQSILDSAMFIKDEAAHYVEQIGKIKKKYAELQLLYDELQRTQAQLVQSEKMASLGKLVAAVVHEMNTPVGVINSSTDVTHRAVTSIIEMLKTNQTLEQLQDNRRFQNACTVLENNILATSAASGRIVKILKSLKSFTRLDEAEFQKVDIHEGIEDVLVLLEPDLGDGSKWSGSMGISLLYFATPAS